MKILVAPNTVQITSTLGRSTAQPRKTNRPVCFHQIWLDCSDLSIYLVFTSGEIYRYDPESINVGRALIAAVNHGLTFNQLYRLFGVSGGMGAYEKVLTIPGSAVLQYQNPPYPGTDPGPCGVNPFEDMIWTQTVSTPPPPVWTAQPATGVQQDNASLDMSGIGFPSGYDIDLEGALNYTGPGGNFKAVIVLTISSLPIFSVFAISGVAQGGTSLVSAFADQFGNVNATFPFTLGPGVGVDENITANLIGSVDGGATASVSVMGSITLLPN